MPRLPRTPQSLSAPFISTTIKAPSFIVRRLSFLSQSCSRNRCGNGPHRPDSRTKAELYIAQGGKEETPLAWFRREISKMREWAKRTDALEMRISARRHHYSPEEDIVFNQKKAKRTFVRFSPCSSSCSAVPTDILLRQGNRAPLLSAACFLGWDAYPKMSSLGWS